jgi:hypothetical protein
VYFRRHGHGFAGGRPVWGTLGASATALAGNATGGSVSASAGGADHAGARVWPSTGVSDVVAWVLRRNLAPEEGQTLSWPGSSLTNSMG